MTSLNEAELDGLRGDLSPNDDLEGTMLEWRVAAGVTFARSLASPFGSAGQVHEHRRSHVYTSWAIDGPGTLPSRCSHTHTRPSNAVACLVARLGEP